MPPKTAVTRAMVEEAAFDIVRAAGADALSVRAIAEKIGCSTQPVYTACGSIASVREAVGARCKIVAETFMRTGRGGEPPFLQIGIGALRFAHEEPHLFRLASEFMRARLLDPPPEAVLAAMRADPALCQLDDAHLRRIHALMWIFAQGLAGLVGPGAAERALVDAIAYLRMAGRAVVAWELNPANNTS